MSGWVKNILGSSAGDLVEKIGNTVDKFVTTDAERAELNEKLTTVVNEYQARANEELTKRLQIDMNSDSWLSKNIRPMTLIFILVTYTVFSVLDENITIMNSLFNVKEDYVTLLGDWGKAIMYFYFGGRTIEKAITAIKSKKNN